MPSHGPLASGDDQADVADQRITDADGRLGQVDPTADLGDAETSLALQDGQDRKICWVQ
jgi:hypothetical protein